MRRIREQQQVIFKREDDHDQKSMPEEEVKEAPVSGNNNAEVQDQQNEYEEEEEEEEEEEQREEREAITHCVHRLPFKGQKVNLDLFYDVVEVTKASETKNALVEPLKKQFTFLASFFKDDQNNT